MQKRKGTKPARHYRESAVSTNPARVLTFQTKNGPVSFACKSSRRNPSRRKTTNEST